jgi:NAD(P)-dependent dehydrogenase (short-subunit alcohol dehydrogenase family)
MGNSSPWTAERIGSQEGRVVIVTGGNSGIGLEAARELYAHGATVIVAGRSEERITRAVEELREGAKRGDGGDGGGAVEAKKLDLADLTSVRDFADWFTGALKYVGMRRGGYTGRAGSWRRCGMLRRVQRGSGSCWGRARGWGVADV